MVCTINDVFAVRWFFCATQVYIHIAKLYCFKWRLQYKIWTVTILNDWFKNKICNNTWLFETINILVQLLLTIIVMSRQVYIYVGVCFAVDIIVSTQLSCFTYTDLEICRIYDKYLSMCIIFSIVNLITNILTEIQ